MKTQNWEICLDAVSSKIALVHLGTKIRVEGEVRLEMGAPGWRLDASRDGVPERLALRNPIGEVQGYLVFAEDGDSLEMRVLHRTAQSFAGKLCFQGNITMAGAFACRTQASPRPRVIQMASGTADSPFNDSLFAPECDTCLQMRGSKPALATLGDGTFALTFTLDIQQAACAAMVFEVKRDFYRKRYVPYYAPIDRKRCPKAPTGWMSWNLYFDQAGSKENLDEARVGAEYLKPYGLEFWSIESWQDNSPSLPVSRFDNLSGKAFPAQFPEGMKYVADEIRRLGFRPGIWVAPFGTGAEDFYQAHRDWFLHDADGKPLTCWNGRYTIDPSNAEVREHIRKLFRMMAEDWGYEFFKIDGMSGRSQGYCAHKFEMEKVQACFQHPECPNPFELCTQAFRDGIGPDGVFLACQGHATGPEAAVADASRSGADIVSPNQPSGWENILSQAHATLNQMFAHNIVFYLDPDTLLVGTYRSLEEARVTATIVGLPGQMMFAGDKLAELPPERMRMLQQTLPVCDIRPLDLYPVFDLLQIWDLKLARSFGQWDVVALFNWSEKEADIVCDFAELGLDADKSYAVYEFWTQAFQDVYAGGCSMRVPPHGVRLLSIHEETGLPQFLSTNRHLTQGGIELETLGWNAETAVLSGTCNLVAKDELTLHFLVPENFTFTKAESDAAILAASVDGDGILHVTLKADDNRKASFSIYF